MLNQETKRHIDAARQVLVGVVPNPSSQIDQITNALIYKFMDDMDQASIKAGGDASFFTGDLEKYAWTKLMDQKIGNQDRMNLYADALQKFSKSSQLPELFRTIFKSAFLPYRSPETLGLFLKEIDYFDYSHSEELGNAYEYLLSIMSSQGDAGQFRTPRHIIEFIVDAINPTKDDKILDPACGTGGFLVSAYKHILEQHDGKDDPHKKEKPLTPDQKKKLMNNFEGYDIDPTMARIAQVNMYLHQFKNPKIVQYDTLSQDERWNDKFDVILANPPFMSPKGGIKPHSKFAIQSSRSEVLFVDYIANHLKPQGRAGIIVPEGIIFQSGTAYKALRKSLVEDGLYAVVSLPSGVFQPYSGVKTSILLFNNELAKQRSELLFLKIENDGFDLGAQRRTSSKNDLPQALEILQKWRIGEKVENKLVSYVEKTKIAENGDYNLGGDRYRVTTDYSGAKWPMVELGEVVEILDNKRRPITKSDRKAGQFPYYGATGILDYIHDYIFDERLVLIGEDGAKWNVGDKTAFIAEGKYWVNNHAHVVRPIKDKLIDTFLVEYLNSIDLSPFITGVTVPKLNQEKLRSIKIPLPPLEIQEQVVRELDGYSAIITGAKQIIANWKPKIDIDPKWEIGAVSDIAKLEYGIGESAKDIGEFRYVRITDIGDNGELKNSDKKYINETDESKKYLLKKGDVLVARTGATFGKTVYFDEDEKSAFAGFLIRLNFDENKISPKYFWCFAQSDNYWEQAKSLMTGGGQPQFNANAVAKLVVPLPSLKIQKEIVAKIEAERALVESAKKLIEIYEQKTKATISKLWNDKGGLVDG
jgi:type I restriction enzyme M protein